jgi:hypothetical protein
MNDCPDSEEYKERQRERLYNLEEEVVKLRTGLARLAFKAGIAEHVPGNPGREAPFEVLDKCARTNERGWNALIARLMDFVPASNELVDRLIGPCSHCECPEAHGPPFPKLRPKSHEPGCDLNHGKDVCSCSPFNVEED